MTIRGAQPSAAPGPRRAPVLAITWVIGVTRAVSRGARARDSPSFHEGCPPSSPGSLARRRRRTSRMRALGAMAAARAAGCAARGGEARRARLRDGGPGVASLAILLLRLSACRFPLLAPRRRRRSRPCPRCARPRAHRRDPPRRRRLGARRRCRSRSRSAHFTFAAALGPETFWDGFEYHLPMSAAWSEGADPRRSPAWLDAELRAGSRSPLRAGGRCRPARCRGRGHRLLRRSDSPR